MVNKRCLTYNRDRTLNLYMHAIRTYCSQIIFDGFTITVLKKLCGAICYSALFILPEHELVNGKVYSFENICYHQVGLLKMALHETLENLSAIAVSTSPACTELEEVLHSALTGEILSGLHLNTKDVYAALLISYVGIKCMQSYMETIIKYANDSKYTYTDLWSYFENEIYPAGYKMNEYPAE